MWLKAGHLTSVGRPSIGYEGCRRARRPLCGRSWFAGSHRRSESVGAHRALPLLKVLPALLLAEQLLAPGALDEPVEVSLMPTAEGDMPLAAPGPFPYIGAFDLDLGGQELGEPAQLAVPINGSAAVGETVYFFRHVELADESGVPQGWWILEEIGLVGADGIARTTSPPYPGFTFLPSSRPYLGQGHWMDGVRNGRRGSPRWPGESPPRCS